MDLLLQASVQFNSYTVLNKICSPSLVIKYLIVAFFLGFEMDEVVFSMIEAQIQI